MVLEFIRLNKDNFFDYVKFIEESESIYPDALRMSMRDYESIVFEDESVAFVLFVNGVFAGNILGCVSLETYEGNKNMPVFDGKHIYLYNLLVLPDFQGKGLGFKLMNEFIKACKRLKYVFVFGNYRLNGSYNIIKKCGVVFEEKVLDWEGSGEDFMFCVIKI